MRLHIIAIILLCSLNVFAQKEVIFDAPICVQNINGDTIELKLDYAPTIILLASENTCSKCYENLEKILSDTKKIGLTNFILLIRLRDCLPCKRDFIKKYPVFRSFDSAYFDIHKTIAKSFAVDDCQDGLWRKLHICRTPALILSTPNKKVVYHYEDLFKDLQLKDSFKQDLEYFISQAGKYK